MSPTQIPSYSPLHLNTSSVGEFIPQVGLVTADHLNAFISERILTNLFVYKCEIDLVRFYDSQ